MLAAAAAPTASLRPNMPGIPPQRASPPYRRNSTESVPSLRTADPCTLADLSIQEHAVCAGESPSAHELSHGMECSQGISRGTQRIRPPMLGEGSHPKA